MKHFHIQVLFGIEAEIIPRVASSIAFMPRLTEETLIDLGGRLALP
jgi:hypothetical protein